MYSFIFTSSIKKSCENISYSFNDTDLSLCTHLHVGLMLCILNEDYKILIKSDLLTSIEILTSFSYILQ